MPTYQHHRFNSVIFLVSFSAYVSCSEVALLIFLQHQVVFKVRQFSLPHLMIHLTFIFSLHLDYCLQESNLLQQLSYYQPIPAIALPLKLKLTLEQQPFLTFAFSIAFSAFIRLNQMNPHLS